MNIAHVIFILMITLITLGANVVLLSGALANNPDNPDNPKLSYTNNDSKNRKNDRNDILSEVRSIIAISGRANMSRINDSYTLSPEERTQMQQTGDLLYDILIATMVWQKCFQIQAYQYLVETFSSKGENQYTLTNKEKVLYNVQDLTAG